jgi:hypothetical protein
MRPRISSNAGTVFKRMQKRGPAVERELTKAAGTIKIALLAEDKRIISQQIYSVPIPTVTRRKRKKEADHPLFSIESRRERGHTFEDRAKPKTEKKWRRTGALLNRETARIRGPVVILSNPMAYAAARYSLGTADGRDIQTPGVQSVQWHVVALENKRTFILTVRRQALLRALTHP